MTRRPLRDALRRREPLVGTVLSLSGASIAELLAEPFDVVWIDLEHGALGPRDAQELLVGAQATGAHALVRLPADAHALATTMLDAGADGIVLAGVDDVETAAAAVRRLRHVPHGTRGWGPRRLASRRRGAAPPAPPSVWAQLESAAGVDRARALAAVAGIDALVVGTADLSRSLGGAGGLRSAALSDAVAAVRDACAADEPAFGVAGALDTLPAATLAGASVAVHATDMRLCAEAADAAAEHVRRLINDRREARRA